MPNFYQGMSSKYTYQIKITYHNSNLAYLVRAQRHLMTIAIGNRGRSDRRLVFQPITGVFSGVGEFVEPAERQLKIVGRRNRSHRRR